MSRQDKKSRKKQSVKDRNKEAIKKAQQKKELEKPENKFINLRNEDGSLKYESAKLMWDYFVQNPDPVLNKMYGINSLLRELRFHIDIAKKCLEQHLGKEPVTIYDEKGNLFSRDQLYVKYISHQHLIPIVISRMRAEIVQNLMTMIDEELFTSEQFDEYVLELNKKVKDLGFELFPKKVGVVKPL